MVRQALKARTDLGQIRARGREGTRLESFSDGVFALAVTLLILSSSVPQTFAELKQTFADVVPFALCITILVLIWYEHFKFFYRYGLQDVTTIALNTLLLFVVLFYVYPLKFLFRILYLYFSRLITGEPVGKLFTEVLPMAEAPSLMVIYGIGAVSIYGILAVMFWHAYRMQNELNLSQQEAKVTRNSIIMNLVSTIPPLLSVLVAVIGIGSTLTTFIVAGNVYMLYPILMPVVSKLLKKDSIIKA